VGVRVNSLSVRNEQSKYRLPLPLTLSVSVHPERETVEEFIAVRAEREERTVEVQASTSAHPEREAVEGRQAQDKRNGTRQSSLLPFPLSVSVHPSFDPSTSSGQAAQDKR